MTDRLYYADSYLTSFTARVTARLTVGGAPAVALDRTAFYPEGGGQPGDRGRLNPARRDESTGNERGDPARHDESAGSERGDQTQVVGVVASDDESLGVLHVLAQPIQSEQVEGAIDWARRFDLMQQHTGQHILSQAFIRTLEAETVAFHLSDDPRDGSVTIDLNRTGLQPSDADRVEDLANQIVFENRPVTARFVTRDDVESMPLRPRSADGPSRALRGLRKPPTVDASIRIVHVEGFDWSACGGTHVARTGEVGQIKIIKLERRGAETRVEFRCGQRALADYRRKNQLINAAAAELSIGFWELDQAAARLLAENKTLYKQAEDARERLLDLEAREVLGELRETGWHAVALRAWPDREMDALRKLAKQIISRPGVVALLGSSGHKPALVFARSSDVPFDMSALVREAAARLGGKGGGSPDFAQAGSPPASIEQMQEALEWAFGQLDAHQ